MKIILELPELEAIVKENIAFSYPNQDTSVTIQNKRNGIEVTVVLTDKQAEKEAKAFTNVSEELAATGCCGTLEDKEVESEEERLS